MHKSLPKRSFRSSSQVNFIKARVTRVCKQKVQQNVFENFVLIFLLQFGGSEKTLLYTARINIVTLASANKQYISLATIKILFPEQILQYFTVHFYALHVPFLALIFKLF